MVHPEIAPWQVAAGLHKASSPPPRNNQGPSMRDTAKHGAEMIEHLEKALTLSEEASEPIIGYLIERALDEARAAQWDCRSLSRLNSVRLKAKLSILART